MIRALFITMFDLKATRYSLLNFDLYNIQQICVYSLKWYSVITYKSRQDKTSEICSV